jgi:hypothetical protein
MAAVIPAVETTDDDAFASAFNDLAALERGDPVAPAADVPVAAVQPDPAVVQPDPAVVQPDPAVVQPDPPVVPAGVGPADPAPATPPPAVDAVDPPTTKPVDASANDDMLRRLAALVKDKEPAPAPAQPQRAAPAEKFTAEETALLAAYDKDWPDQSRAEAIRRRADARDLIGYVFAEVSKELQPLMATVQELSARTQLSDLETNVPDYNNALVDKVTEWVKTQPAYLRPAYEHVVKRGTVEDVAHLVAQYRQATGDALPSAPAAAPVAPALAPAVKKAAAALAPVKSIRSALPAAGLDPNNFDAAFESFEKAEAAKDAAEVARRAR